MDVCVVCRKKLPGGGMCADCQRKAEAETKRLQAELDYIAKKEAAEAKAAEDAAKRR